MGPGYVQCRKRGRIEWGLGTNFGVTLIGDVTYRRH